MAFIVKAALGSKAGAKIYAFHEKTMYGGKNIRVGDEIFVFDSENEGGCGLCAKGVVTFVAQGVGSRRRVKVRRTARARHNLGRVELKPFRELVDDRPETEIARRFYRQATNKIGGISDKAAKFLNKHF